MENPKRDAVCAFFSSVDTNAKNNLSSVIGLDSFYKLCTDHWAIGVLICPNKNNHYDPFGKKEPKEKLKKKFSCICIKAIGITKDWNEKTVKKFVQVALDAVNSEWKPVVMIDHDEAERAGVELCGLKFILCNFHVIKAISKNLTKMKVKKKVKKKTKTFFH